MVGVLVGESVKLWTEKRDMKMSSDCFNYQKAQKEENNKIRECLCIVVLVFVIVWFFFFFFFFFFFYRIFENNSVHPNNSDVSCWYLSCSNYKTNRRIISVGYVNNMCFSSNKSSYRCFYCYRSKSGINGIKTKEERKFFFFFFFFFFLKKNF